MVCLYLAWRIDQLRKITTNRKKIGTHFFIFYLPTALIYSSDPKYDLGKNPSTQIINYFIFPA